MFHVRQIATGLFSLIAISLLAAVPVVEAEAASCNLNDIVNSYQSGKNHDKRGNVRGAIARWLPLAKAGMGPAQREMAKLFEAGRGAVKSIADAAFWAELSFRFHRPPCDRNPICDRARTC